MAHTVKLQRGGVDAVDLNDGTNFTLTAAPWKAPARTPDGKYDLVTPVEEVLQADISGASADGLLNNKNKLERALRQDEGFADNPQYGSVGELVVTPQGATNTARAQIQSGWVELPQNAFDAEFLSFIIPDAPIHISRLPYWDLAESALTLVTSPTDNGANNYAVLPAVVAEVPSPLRLRVTGTGGNIANCQRLLCALRATRNPANFIQRLQVAGVSGYTFAADPESLGASYIALTADANFLSGSKLRYVPPDMLDHALGRWTISANTADQFGRFLATVRYRDNSTTPCFKLKFRTGVLVGAVPVWGPYWDLPQQTLFADSTGTTEIGMLSLGEGGVPSDGIGWVSSAAVMYELHAQAITTAVSLDVDYLSLWPMGEAGGGRGLVQADFPVPIVSNRAYLDMRLRQERAYLTDGSDVVVCRASNYTHLGEIYTWPNQTAQRLFFAVLRDSDSFCKHSASTSLSVSAFATPRYLSLPGTA